VAIGPISGASHQAEDLPKAVDWALRGAVLTQRKQASAG
jgi:hypothetical protein